MPRSSSKEMGRLADERTVFTAGKVKLGSGETEPGLSEKVVLGTTKANRLI